MDTFRAFDDEIEIDAGADDEPVMERPPEIGVDERRMHVRAYNYWVSMLNGRAYPSIRELQPDRIEDFGPNSVLLDFTGGCEDPVIAYLGAELRRECALPRDIRHISQVPSRSLLSRLTDHYLQIIANCAPIGFEAEFSNRRGASTMYRGILMPLSSDGDTIDFIYGVINWKELVDAETAAGIAIEVDRAVAAPLTAPGPVWADGPNAELDESVSPWGESLPESTLDPNAGLADRLCAARASAEAAKGADGRSRAALYRALAEAYDFALAAEAEPDTYADILKDAGVKAQARAPMTPVVKLVFGIDYDKTRLTEFAAALSFARRQALPHGGFQSWIEGHEGGLKGAVRAERRARRPALKPDRLEAALDSLRRAEPLARIEVPTEEGEFVLLIARREAEGGLSVVAPGLADKSLVERAIRKNAA